ncbi:U32 family peptidase [Conexibacter woesei]|uniref:Peptidase U32 n=1 Tax=Conexibacter woesei (strain DSM 14684 / CCUG 47730 / CIP 108061 / JCM 11494 / NBRC 100937 / ID131577) TaxID=469383 RepID=D3FDE1_CONWI|nr:U32 family peptidase [Conexibacter woesei]ADB53533.1 hypothetical protein Cwoe_5124 [Conexibacter woesei DSM 14684]
MLPTRELLADIGLPASDAHHLPDSPQRFPDGGQWRLEIPSTEGPESLREVLAAGDERGLRVHRVSQGSGIMLQTDAEIREMVELGAARDVEVSLFVGPRAAWDVGVQATTDSGRLAGMSLRGADQLGYALDDVARACELGLRSVLVSDLGLLSVLGQLRARGDLPSDLVLKVSVSLPAANPATARVLQELGATTINLPVDLTLAQLAAIRAAVDVPLDLYIETTDDFGGLLRYHEIPEIVRVAAPVYLKFAVRNSPGLYPAGGHLRDAALATARERVRRAAIGLELLARNAPGAVMSETTGYGTTLGALATPAAAGAAGSPAFEASAAADGAA